MGPELKKRLWGRSLVIVGVGLLLYILIYGKTHHPLSHAPLAIMSPIIVGIIIGTLFCYCGGAIMHFYVNDKEAALAWRWWCLLGNEEFPRDEVERNAYRQKAYYCLHPLAIRASNLFFLRDKVGKEKKEAGDAAFPPAKNGEELRQFRANRKKNLAGLTSGYEDKKARADYVHHLYIKTWKLFEDLGMIPLKPGTDELFGNPEEFRTFCGEHPRAENSAAAEPGANLTLNMPTDQ